jgi:heme-degrading monooxygenase HmoA
MSVIMTMRAKGDAAALERVAAEDPQRLQAILDRAKAEGLIAHRFYSSGDGEIMVCDEWPDPESFKRFFEAAGPEIEPLMAAAGIAEEPEVKFWTTMNMGDEVGWGA